MKKRQFLLRETVDLEIAAAEQYRRQEMQQSKQVLAVIPSTLQKG